MRRIVLRGLFLLVAVVVSCAAILVVMPEPSNTFYLAAEDKWERADSIGSPKIMIVGGSNTIFGLSSRTVQEAFDRPVVNFGLNAGLGLKYMLAEAGQFLGPGDIVVVSPEYEQFYGTTYWGSQQLVALAWLHPPSLRLMLAPRQLAAIARGFPVVFQSRFRSWWLDVRTPGRETWDEVYNRDAFNELGDVVSHLDVESERPVSDMNFLRDSTAAFNRAAIHGLDEFAEEAAEVGARVFVLLPTIPAYHYPRRREMVQRVYDRLLEDGNVPVLGPPESQVAPDDDFFDTSYHLSAEGRAARTQRLIDALRARLE